MSRKLLVGLFVALLGSVIPSRAQVPRLTAIRAGHLFDSKTGRLLSEQVVLVQGDRIVQVGAQDKVKIPDGVEVIDLSQTTVLPGLIDGHTHVFDSLTAAGRVETSVETWTLMALKNAQADLRAGFTTIRDVGTHGEGYGDIAVRDAIQKGLFDGPRMQVSTRAITAGAPYLGAPGFGVATGIQNIRGADDATAAVREQIHYGADWIKVLATAGYSFSSGGDLFVPPVFTVAELQAIVNETHRLHHKVACHAFGGEGLRDCIEAGVDSVEHGQGLDNELISEMLQKEIYYEPTLFRYSLPDIVERDRVATNGKYSIVSIHNKAFQLALSRGVKISFGSGVDGRPYAHGTQGNEFEALVKHGMSPAAAIQSSTNLAAEMMGWQDQVGSLEAGKYADLIAVSGNPLSDITELQRVKFVMKGGKVVRNDLK